MQTELFEVKRERFHLLIPNRYILQGTWPKGYEVSVYLDDKCVRESTIEDWKNTSALDRFSNQELSKGKTVTVMVDLPEDIGNYKRLRIYARKDGRQRLWHCVKASVLAKRMGKPCYYMEEERVDVSRGYCRLQGWVVFQDPVAIEIRDDAGEKLNCGILRSGRLDVAAMFPEVEIDSKCCFFVELSGVKTQAVNLVFQSGEIQNVHRISFKKSDLLKKEIKKYSEKALRYMQTHGLKAVLAKGIQKIASLKKTPITYEEWLPRHLSSKAELSRQETTAFSIRPKFSIVVPLYRTPVEYLRRMFQSVMEQTYPHWELCLSDGSGQPSPIEEILKEYMAKDKRIRVISNPTSLQISENTNQAIKAATGDYIVFVDHDDEITPGALYECVQAINDHPGTAVLYSDEDKMSMDGKRFFMPHFKPDFNLDLLCTVNYISHLFVVKKTLVDQVGMLRSSFDGAQDYDFILRCVEADQHIHHIPKILYHWRSHENSTAENPESKGYAFDAGQRAVKAHYDRIGVKAEVKKGEYLGLYRTKYMWDEKPLISIIIPNKDHVADLKRCISSIDEKSTYLNYEYIIVENNSTEKSTFEYYQELEKENSKAKVVYWDGIFNYSQINNFGVSHAKGQYLLLLNNDTEVINEDCLEELLGYCMRSDVGAVGARLYYEDDTVQHAGVIIGFSGIAGHCFVMQPRGVSGYCHRIICAQDYSAVTAACMMVKRSVFEELGGLDEGFEVAFNDVDFCLRMNEAGYRVVYNPYAELYHYESKSRGLEDTPEKVARFNGEIAAFEKRWSEILRKGDPYYNPNLTLESQDFSLKQI